MFGPADVWSGDSSFQSTYSGGGSGRGGTRQWRGADSQGGRAGQQYHSNGGCGNSSGGRGGRGRGGQLDINSDSGEGGRVLIRDLVPHQPNTVIIGLVITKQSVHSFPDKKNPGEERFKLAFTMRDSPSDYINVTCWGSESYIRSLVDSFKICDVVELRNAQILSKTGGEAEERWKPWTSSGHQLNATEGHTTISLYTGWDYTDFTTLAHIPLRPSNDYYPLSDVLASGQTLDGAHINLLAIVRHVHSPKQMRSRSGKPLKKCEVRLMDDGCSSFSFTIWDEELIDLAQTWTPKENIVFVVDAKVNFNNYINSMVASCDQKTIITTNPDCREAHQLYQYAQGLGELNTEAEEEKESAGNNSFTDISVITKVYTIAELLAAQMSGKEASFSGILYALLMAIDIDEETDPGRIISFRWMKAQQGSRQCTNTACPSLSSSSSSYATEAQFSLPLTLADHTGGLEGVRLAGKAASDLLQLTPEEFLGGIHPEDKMALKLKLQLERFKIYFKSGVVSGDNQRPLVRVLSMSPAQPGHVAAAATASLNTHT